MTVFPRKKYAKNSGQFDLIYYIIKIYALPKINNGIDRDFLLGYTFSMRNILFFIIPFLSFLITGCLDLNSEITVNTDGSGKVELQYHISKLALELRRTGNEEGPIPLPVQEDNFRNAAEAIQGISLTGYDRKETADDVVISAEIDFTSIEALNNFYSMSGGQNVSLLGQGDSVVFSMFIFGGRDEPVDEETVDLIDSFFSDYNLSFRLNAPGTIISVEPGTIDESGKRADHSVSVADLIKTGEPVIWQVSWKD